MKWRCTLEGYRDVVVPNPPAARRWLEENNIDGHWRQAFDPERTAPPQATPQA